LAKFFENFAKKLASYAEIYINNAFASSHRAHASIVGIPNYIPAFAGLILQKEIEMLSIVTENPQHPFLVISGFAKISDKIELLEKLLEKAEESIAEIDMLGLINANVISKGRHGRTREVKLSIPQNLIDKVEEILTESLGV
jgi:phosphoglycerate kinase